jgi:predicted ATPase/Tfp pilus assembly protein PilF
MNYLWRIELFGGLRAVFNPVLPLPNAPPPIERFRTQKTASLLAFLAFTRKAHAREVLTELLWPDHDPKTGGQNLRTALSSLRRQLEPPGVAAGTVLLSNRTQAGLNPLSIATDVEEFRAALRDAKNAFDCAFQVENYERAIALYAGRFLPGLYDEWATREAECLQAEYFAALTFLIRHYEKAHDDARVRQLAQLGARFDDAPEAIGEVLRRLEPEPDNARRRKRRKTAAPETVPIDAPSPPRISLPPQFTRFFGREAEIARVRDEFQSGSTRLLTLTGAGGSGKTRLAIEAARHLFETAPAGTLAICFVPLTDVHDPALVGATIINALQLPRVDGVLLTQSATAGAFPGEQLAAALQARPTLLVFDNFEHLTEASSLLELLLARVSHLKILVTSQHRLHVAGERELPVAPLPTPAVADAFESVAASPSVQLFVDRAQLARADFQITPQNAADVARLCIELEGAPLALELAAARIGVLTPGQIASQLAAMRESEHGRLDFLHQPRRAATPRHQSLRTAIAWSYNLLPPDLARFWTRLAVFRGGFTPEAAGFVADQPGALHLLGQLRTYSLLATEERDGAMRFRWSGMLREFACEQLDQRPDAHDTRRRHAEYFCDLFADAVLRLRTPDESHALRLATTEADNARAALEWAEREQEYSLSSALALSLGTTLQRRGLHREARERFAAGLAATEHLSEEYDARRVDLLREAAGVSLDLMHWDDARENADALHHLCRRLGDERGLAAAVNLLGLAAKSARQWKRAREYFARALTAFERQGDIVGAANVCNNLGLIEYLDARGDKAAAQVHLHEALRLRRELDDARGVAEACINLGALAQQRNDLDEAEHYYREALGIELHLYHLFGVGRALCNLGEIAEERDAFDSAFRLYVAAQSLFEVSGVAYRNYSAECAARLEAYIPAPQELRKAADHLVQRGEIAQLVEWAGAEASSTPS